LLDLNRFHDPVGFARTRKDSGEWLKSKRKRVAGRPGTGVTSADRAISNRYRYFRELTHPATGRYDSDICECKQARGGCR